MKIINQNKNHINAKLFFSISFGMVNFSKKVIVLFLISMIFVPQVFAVSTSTNFRVFLNVNAEIPPATGGGGGGVGTNLPIIFDVVVVPSEYGAVITYKTNILASSTLSFGKTQDVSGGSVSNINVNTNHSITLSNLTANTIYYFSIEAISPTGAKGQTKILTFHTLKLEPVVNALSFNATAQTEDIRLDWRMATGQENNTVRIVRNEGFYPTSVNDGKTIFEGAGKNQIIDADVVKGVHYYYTLFIKGNDGKYSSGAVADATILLEGQVEEKGDVFDRLSKAPFVDARIESLTLADFTFSQPGREDFSTQGNETLFIEGDKNLTIKLSYDRVPEILKTVAVTLTEPDDVSKKFVFLLRVNEEKTFYEASIAPLGKSGEYKLSIAIVDYKNQGLKKITGNLLAVVSRSFTGEGVFVTPRGFNTNDLMVSVVMVLALIALSYVSARKIDFSYLLRVWSRYRPQRRI